jgi:glycosyltransferase involved in cell wall biosynthesis
LDHWRGRQRRECGEKLKVLFVGTLSLRKGIQYLLQAARYFHGARMAFRAVGPIHLSESATNQVRNHIEVVGSVPRSELRMHYEWADVFVLPTLSEGSANVCYEALASGLPVVTTPNAGSVVQDQIDGFIVPPAVPEALIGSLDELRRHPDRIPACSRAALSRMKEFSWECYRRRLLESLASVGGGKGSTDECENGTPNSSRAAARGAK